MRIVRIRHLFYPYMPRDYFYELSSKQAEKGHEIHVITWGRARENTIEKVSNKFFIHRLIGLNLVAGLSIENYPYLINLNNTIKEINPDIIHAESHLFLPSLQALMIAKKMHIPCVVSVHGVLADRGFFINLLQKLYIHSIGLLVFKLANEVICLTSEDASAITNLGVKPQKISIVPNGVDTNLFKPNNDEYTPQVVWVGRFVPEKGVEYLIKAAEIV